MQTRQRSDHGRQNRDAAIRFFQDIVDVLGWIWMGNTTATPNEIGYLFKCSQC